MTDVIPLTSEEIAQLVEHLDGERCEYTVVATPRDQWLRLVEIARDHARLVEHARQVHDSLCELVVDADKLTAERDALRAQLDEAKANHEKFVTEIHRPMPCGHPIRYDDSFGGGGGEGCWICTLDTLQAEHDQCGRAVSMSRDAAESRTQLDEAKAEMTTLREALGMMSTAAPHVVVDSLQPISWAIAVVEAVRAERAALDAANVDNTQLRERVRVLERVYESARTLSLALDDPHAGSVIDSDNRLLKDTLAALADSKETP